MPPLLAALLCFLLFFATTLGLAWPLAARLALDPAEKLVASVVLSLLGVYLAAWAVYVFALPLATLSTLPALAAAGLWFGRRPLAEILHDADARSLVAGQSLVTLWCVGALALVKSYSGGQWVGDWFGHLQRAWFFLEHWRPDILFNGFDPLTSRPPLANVVTGAFLAITLRSFDHYQLITTLLGSIAFLPAALLARRFGDGRAVATLAVLLMLSPLFVENATFAWTKLPAAFFALAALYFFLRAHDPRAPASAGNLCAAGLAAALLTHYSAGPYAVVLALAWLAFGWPRRGDAAWWRLTAGAALTGTLLLATWFGWSLAVLGAHRTFLSNTAVTDQAPTLGAQLAVVALNLRDTFVPHFLRHVDGSTFTQRSPWGWWRDWFFQLYQVDFFFAFGSVAWAAILVCLARAWPRAPRGSRAFWAILISVTAVLGVAVHGARNEWGLAHICLQPLVLLGLAFLAGCWASFGRGWRYALVAGATVDFLLGIVLQFGTESYAFDRWFAPGQSIVNTYLSYSSFALINLRAKLQNQWVLFGDLFAPYFGWVVTALGVLLMVALFRAQRAFSSGRPKPPADSGPRP